ncbi:AAA family ATPase [Candidatus Poribacteria bacterium]|nr:AAA family ATPase [Candidatus Poribacteria bacterium]
MPKLFVKNFINIREAEIDMDKTLVVFIGETASGKSVLAKLLYLFQELIRDFRQYIRQINTYPPEHLKISGQEVSTVFRTQIARKFREFFGDATGFPTLNGSQQEDVNLKRKPTGDSPIADGRFEITYHYTAESAIRLILTDEESLHIELPAVMDKVEDLCYNLLEKLKSVDIKPSHSIATEPESGKETDASAEDTPQRNKNTDQFHYILNMAIGMSDITETLAGKHRDGLFIPADRNIASNYPDALKRIFYGGIKSDLHTRTATRSRANLHLIARFLEKNEEFLDTFSTQNFRNLFDERIAEEAKEVDKPIMEFLLKKISLILNGEYETIDKISQSRLFSHPTGENTTFLENASTGQQNLIRILQDAFMSMLYNEMVFRVIEEPEAHLHPATQKHLMHIIALMRNHIDSQIVMTTHSPYLLAVLKNLLTAGRRSKKNPKAAAEIEGRIPKLCWLMPEDVEVYHLKDGISRAIVQPKKKSILPNPLADLLTGF